MIAEQATDADLERASALSDREYDLISRIHQICIWLAKNDRDQVLKTIAIEYGVVEAVALQWMLKAEDFMALGVIDDVESARRMYLLRLSRVYDLCMANAVRDMVEVTTKPIRLQIDTSQGQPTGQAKIVQATVTKVKPRALDVGACNVALKAARESAYIAGARPSGRKGALFGAVGTLNMQINNGEIPGAQVTQELTDQALAAQLGVEVVGVLPPDQFIDVEAAAGPGTQQADSQTDGPDAGSQQGS